MKTTKMKWLSNIFKKPEKVNITLDQLPDWFKQETKGKLAKIDEETADLKREIKQELKLIEEKTEKLQDLSLRNEKIDPKERQYMKGNRENYIRQIRYFLNEVEDFDSDPRQLCKDFESNLHDLNNSSARSYKILQHFFSNELQEIALHIKRIEVMIKIINRKVNAPEIEAIHKVKDIIKELFRKLELDKKREIEIEELKAEADTAQKQKEVVDKMLESIRKSEEDEEYHEGLEKIKKAKENEAKAMSDLTNLFSPLEKALKKYQKLTIQNQDLIEMYISDLPRAVTSDFKWEIIMILQSVERYTTTNQLELTDDKRVKTLEQIKKITKEKLEDHKKRINYAKLEKTGAEERLKTNKALEKEKAIELKINNINTAINNMIVRMNTSKKDLEDSKVNKAKEDLMKTIAATTGKGVEILI